MTLEELERVLPQGERDEINQQVISELFPQLPKSLKEEK